MKTLIIPLLICSLGLLSYPQSVLSVPAESAMAPANKELSALYWQGQEDLKRADWQVALQRFQDLEKQLRSKEPRNVDTALYWQAYTLVQAKRHAEARAVTDRLHREFPESRWGKEAIALARERQAASNSSDMGQDDMAEIAVDALLTAPPERAFPLLKKVLQSQRSSEVKKRALFVLSQHGSAEALQLVFEVARNDPDPKLRERAIHMLGVSGDRAAISRLSELYAAPASSEVKRKIIQAWLIAGRKDLVLASARTESDPKVSRAAVQALGAMNATQELKQLLLAAKDPKTRSAIVQALGIAGDLNTLAELAASQQSEPTRVEAMQALGIAGGKAQLVKLYSSASSQALRDGALKGLLITGDSEAVLELYRAAKSDPEKKSLLRMLTIMDSSAAMEAIEKELQ